MAGLIGARLQGRLGNQLFQYAAARCVAEHLGCGVVLVGPRQRQRWRTLARPLRTELSGAFRYVTFSPTSRWLNTLQAFSQPAFASELGRLLPHRFRPRKTLSGGQLLAEAYDPAIWQVAPGTLIEGYFQSEQYFQDRAATVRRWFTPSRRTAAVVDDLLAGLRGNVGDYVAVHVRLGDYASHSLRVGDVLYPYALGRDYYDKALDRFPPGVPVALFSDEPDAAAALLPSAPAWVCPAASPVVTLLALARFPRLIIANSSFSWWAGWLGGPNNAVVAPHYHMGRAAGLWYPADIMTDGWTYL